MPASSGGLGAALSEESRQLPPGVTVMGLEGPRPRVAAGGRRLLRDPPVSSRSPGSSATPAAGRRPGPSGPFSPGRPPSSASSPSSSSGRRVTGRRRSGRGGAVREDGARCEAQGRGALGPGAALPGCGERSLFPGPGGQAALETQPPESGTPAPTLMGLGGPHELVKGVHHAWASRAVRPGPFHPRVLGHVPELRASVPSSLKRGVGLDGPAATGRTPVRVHHSWGRGRGGAGTSPSCRLNPAQPLAPGAPPALFYGLSSRFLPERPL